MTTILLADHHTLFRAGTVKLIESIGGFDVAGEVETKRKLRSSSLASTPRIFC